ncbi:MAG: phenylalanine--tRNA ligase subunit beta [Acutalibacteraceae bacterium]
MLAPLSWLKEYVDIDITPQELEKKLFSSGFEVEALEEVGKDITNVVVGLVETCEAIEGTHLHLCTVNCGEHGTFQICCGANNVQAGGKYPTALVGATVYATAKDHVTIEGVMTIKEGKLRGYDSFGMLCSGTELGLNDNLYSGAGYNGLLVLPEDAPVGSDVKPILGMDDWIFDISITANRPDCQSIIGISREIAAALGKEFKMPALDYTETDRTLDDLTVEVKAPQLCPRYCSHYVHDVTIADAPQWMKRRLALVGCSSINNIVDITNYVLKEFGQPVHAFDLSQLEGHHLEVRCANDGEMIKTLDEKDFKLNSNNLVICDSKKPVALAGIMGGFNSEIENTTTEVVIETAKFARENVRRTSRALGQRTDSSARFEKGVDEYSAVVGMKRVLHLIEELNCGKISKTEYDVNTGNSIEPTPLEVSISRINGQLGITVPNDDIKRILTNLDFQPEIDGDTLKVMVPPYRKDVECYQDISEEVIRLYGYDNIKPTFLKEAQVTVGGLTTAQRNELNLKKALCSDGYYECIHYSFASAKDFDMLHLPQDAPERNAIRIMNPISEDLSIMRTMLLPSMVNSVVRNARRGNLEGRLFEVANVFIPKELPLKDYPDEFPHLSICAFGANENFFTAKGAVDLIAKTFNLEFTYSKTTKPYLHPGQTATISCNGTEIGFIGVLAYDIMDELGLTKPVILTEIDLRVLSQFFGNQKRYTPLPKFPVKKRDLALIMDKSVTCAEVTDCIKNSCSFITEVSLFDVYEGKQIAEDKKSMAFNIVFTPAGTEFKDTEIDGYIQTILNNLETAFGIEIRS